MFGAVPFLLMALVAPVALVTVDDSTPDDPPPATSEAVSASTAPTGSASDGGEAGGPPDDIEFQIDMMLGLLPQEEMEDFWDQQSKDAERATQACMNEAGFEYNPEGNRGLSVDPRADMSPVEYAERWGFGVYTTMDPDTNPFNVGMDDYVWPNQEIVDALSSSEQNAWFELLNRCQNDAYAGDDPWRNPMVQQALEDFNTQVENDRRSQDALDTWRECMEAAGHPFADEQAMYDTMFDNEMQNTFYETEAWEADSSDHAQWQAKVEEEIAVAVANAECSPPLTETREEVVAELRPGLVEVWRSIDWSLPPVTFPGEGDFTMGTEVGAFVPTDSTIDDPTGTDAPPVALDLSDPADTTTPRTSET